MCSLWQLHFNVSEEKVLKVRSCKSDVYDIVTPHCCYVAYCSCMKQKMSIAHPTLFSHRRIFGPFQFFADGKHGATQEQSPQQVHASASATP